MAPCIKPQKRGTHLANIFPCKVGTPKTCTGFWRFSCHKLLVETDIRIWAMLGSAIVNYVDLVIFTLMLGLVFVSSHDEIWKFLPACARYAFVSRALWENYYTFIYELLNVLWPYALVVPFESHIAISYKLFPIIMKIRKNFIFSFPDQNF